MRALIAAAFLLSCMSVAVSAPKPIARLQLPCESRYQDLSPTGTQVAVHCKDRSLRLIDVPSGKEQHVFSVEQRVNSSAYSPDGRWFAAGFDDGMVEVISAAGGAPPKRWKAGSRRIDTLYLFPDGKTIVVGAVDQPAQVWEITDTPVQRATLPFDFGGLIASVVSHDGKVLVTAGDDTVIRWYDTVSWEKTREYRGFLLETFALTFTPDGKNVLAGGADSRITLLDAVTAERVRQLPSESGSYIVGIDILGDTQRAATVYLDGAGEKPPHQLVWDLKTANAVPIKADAPLTCGGVVGGRLWICSAQGNSVNVSQYE
jgi:WD40 repeat protein